MSATTTPTSTTTELKFHPDFTPPVNSIILQANDDTCFWFDFDMLKSCSSFFRDLGEMPLHTSAEEDNAKDKVIPLPTATGDGLALALNLVRGHKQPFQRSPIPWPSSDTIDNLVEICRAYDMPMLRAAGCRFKWVDR
ncbi:uncharacterized protein LOC62_04G006578 [Vanrija pseudolonga]|uniref:BTB domain-containing protein n=1 Tax=Vanrija pseudolonga TaxID=143232 RepID=A0AAF1BJT4_9TREE|nr:hypothetical protein LOC62_04G006578 [Vanrija pseudolonga]